MKPETAAKIDLSCLWGGAQEELQEGPDAAVVAIGLEGYSA